MGNKTHIILVALLLLLILFAAHIARQVHTDATVPDGPIVIDETRYIHLIRADWGLNCHGKKYKVSPSVTLGISEEGVYDTPFYEVAKNNAFARVEEICKDQTSCTLEAKSDFLGFDPAEGCKKELTVEYRCFSYDTPWIKKARQNQRIIVDCSPPAP